MAGRFLLKMVKWSKVTRQARSLRYVKSKKPSELEYRSKEVRDKHNLALTRSSSLWWVLPVEKDKDNRYKKETRKIGKISKISQDKTSKIRQDK